MEALPDDVLDFAADLFADAGAGGDVFGQALAPEVDVCCYQETDGEVGFG